MQDGGSVAVQRRLRIARGAAGVAHARGRVLVEARPFVGGRLAADPGLVAHQVGNAAVLRQLVGVAQRHELADGRAARVHGLHQRQEGHVEAQHLVFGVVGDPGDLVGMQARIDGVEHAAGTADAEVQLQVAVAVPRQRGHPVGKQQVHAIQRMRHLARPHGDVPPTVAMNVALDAPRHDLAVAMVALGEIDQGRDQQRLALHQTQHGYSWWR